MNKDDLIREFRNNTADWPAVVGVYAVIIGGMVLSASAII